MPPSNATVVTVTVERTGYHPDANAFWIESDVPNFGIGLPPMEYTPKVGDVFVFYWDGLALPGTRPLGCSINGGPYIAWPSEHEVLRRMRERHGWE